MTFRILKLTLLFNTILLWVACNNENTGVKTQTETAVAKPIEPPFLDEGDLHFLDNKGKELAKIDIEIVETEAEHNQGLMYRTHMGEFQGMLFLFEKPEPRKFWMRNTYISLDIIYVNENKEVVSIQKNAAPMNDESLPSEKKAQYVVEVNAGFSDKFGIEPGCKIRY
jgi:uncharacterized protein